jgi:hypothetical protein
MLLTAWANVIRHFRVVINERAEYTRGQFFSQHGPSMNIEIVVYHDLYVYEQAVSDLDPQRSMHRPVYFTHRLFIEWLNTTKNTASECLSLECLSSRV